MKGKCAVFLVSLVCFFLGAAFVVGTFRLVDTAAAPCTGRQQQQQEEKSPVVVVAKSLSWGYPKKNWMEETWDLDKVEPVLVAAPLDIPVPSLERDQQTALRLWEGLRNPMRRLVQMYCFNDRDKILNADIDIVVYWRHKYQKRSPDINGLHYWINYNLENLKGCGARCNIWLLHGVNIYFMPKMLQKSMRAGGVYFIEQYLIGQILAIRRLYRREALTFSMSFDDWVESNFWQHTLEAVEKIRKTPPVQNYCFSPKTQYMAFPLAPAPPGMIKAYPIKNAALHIYLGFYARKMDDVDDAIWLNHVLFFDPKYFKCEHILLPFSNFYGQRPRSASNTQQTYAKNLALAKDMSFPNVKVGNTSILKMSLAPYLLP